MNKVLSCVLSFLPLVLFILSMVGLIVFAIVAGEGTMSVGGTIALIALFIFELITVVLTFGIMIWYMIKACKNPELSTGMKVLWCALLYCFNMIAFPVFWFMYIKNEY